MMLTRYIIPGEELQRAWLTRVATKTEAKLKRNLVECMLQEQQS